MKIKSVVEVKNVVIELDRTELRILKILLGNIAGDMKNSLRKYTDPMYDEIDNVCPEDDDWYDYFKRISIETRDNKVFED